MSIYSAGTAVAIHYKKIDIELPVYLYCLTTLKTFIQGIKIPNSNDLPTAEVK